MQCVILAAGKGTRMRPLTETTPKPLVQVCGTSLLDHVVAALPSEVTEIILVVGYLEEQIREHCGKQFHGRSVSYVTQVDFAGGTGDALMCAKELITGKFLLMSADDIHGAAALKEAVQHEHAILAAYADEPQHFGVLVEGEDGGLLGIIEKPKDPPGNKVNIASYVLQPSIFNYDTKVSEELGEVLVTDMITDYAKDNFMQIVMQDMWITVSRPEDIEKAEQILCPK